MIEALQQAKKIISKLSVSSFLQKDDLVQSTFLQLSNHLDTAQYDLKRKHHKGMIQVLATLSKDVAIQAD